MEALMKKDAFYSGCTLTMLHLNGCKKCQDEIVVKVSQLIAARAGSVRSAKRAKASRENGKLGGRPRKPKEVVTVMK